MSCSPLPSLAEVGTPLVAHDLGLDPHRREVGLDQLGRLHRLRHVGPRDRHGPQLDLGVEIELGLGEQLLGLFRVVVIRLDGIVVGPDGGRERVLGRDGQPRENRLDQGVLVDGVAERLAHLGVLQPGLFGVERKVAHVHARPLDDRDLRVLLDQGDGIRVEVVGDVHRAGLQGHQARRGLGDGLENDLVHLGLLAPVVVVALEHDLVVLGPAHEFEGPGAHRVRVPIFSLRSAMALGERIGQSQSARLFSSGA